MASVLAGFEAFLEDIAPFFHRRKLTYVDVGAFIGEVSETVLRSKLQVREAHLVEPNPTSLEAARQRLGGQFKGKPLTYYNLAMGARAGHLRMRAAKNMTRVVADAAEPLSAVDGDAKVFDVESSTLDELSHRVTDRRISLLKIDVEGFEDQVLAGAQEVLKAQLVDVIYVEAGMNPEGTQQCYYRRIEDILVAHGYRLFRIYEQQFEWMEDSPLLRRVNMAFMSQRFADANPFRLTQELYQAHQDLAQAQQDLAQAQTALGATATQVAALEQAMQALRLEAQNARDEAKVQLRAALERAASERGAAMTQMQANLAATVREHETALAKLQAHADDAARARDAARAACVVAERVSADLQQRLGEFQARSEAAARERATLATGLGLTQAEQARLRKEGHALRQRIAQAEHRHQLAAGELGGVLQSVGEMNLRMLATQADAATARDGLAKLKRSRVYRVARALADHRRPPSAWLAMLPAVWKALAPVARPAVARADDPRAHVLSFQSARSSLTFPLFKRPQTLVLPASPAPYDVWLRSYCADTETPLRMMLLRCDDAGTQSSAMAWGDGVGPRRPLVVGQEASLPLTVGRSVCVLHVAAGTQAAVLELRGPASGRCVVRFELRTRNASVDHQVAAPARAPKSDSNPAGGTSSTAVARLPVAPPIPDSAQAGGPFTSEELEWKLWGGYASDALLALTARRDDKAVSVQEREAAAWYMARWYSVEGEVQRALDEVAFIRKLTKKPHRRVALLEAQCLLQLGRDEEADACLLDALKTWPEIGRNFTLTRSTVARTLALKRGLSAAEADAAQLDALNVFFKGSGMALLEKRDPGQPLSLANLIARAEPKELDQDRKVSVVVPCFNAESSIAWVIDGLLRQTWKNLEIIVVDDLSTDRSCEVVQAMAERDPRVRLVRQPVNGGAYATRNAGVRLATGHYVTVNDSDDWSHPEKIERQIDLLDASPGKVGVISHWVRVGEQLEIVGPWIPRGGLFDVNFSSLLVERRLIDEIGLWDEVRISGDAEFYYRLRWVHGPDCIAKLPNRYLLSLSLARDDSLTRSKATHMRSLFYGLRWNYRDAYLSWAALPTPGTDTRVVDPATGRRKFPMPVGCRPGTDKDPNYDLVVVADFAEPGEPLRAALACIAAARKAAQRVGTFHWRKYERQARASLQSAYYDTWAAHDFDILSPGDKVNAAAVMVFDPTLLDHKIDPTPDWQALQVAVIVDAPATAAGDHDPQRAQAHVRSLFGRDALWLPASDAVRGAMQRDGRYPRSAAPNWLPLVDGERWVSATPKWRGGNGQAPVIGRHGSRDAAQWPANAATLRAAYGTDPAWTVRVLGDVSPATALAGDTVAQWEALPESDDAPRFLKELDFYVYYPGPSVPAQLTQGLAEAMAAGTPVVLPPHFESVVGSAAGYAEPADAAALIAALWASQGRYHALAQAGRDFVRQHCGLDRFPARLQAIVTTLPAPVAAAAG